MTRRIAILDTCNDTAEYTRAFPHDGERFRLIMQPLRPDWRFEVFLLPAGEFPEHPLAFDGYVITGSPASVNDPDPWIARLKELIRALDRARVKTIGACFGHQAIATALGGKVERARQGWALGTATTRFTVTRPWMQPARTDLTLFAAHAEQVTVLPPGAEILGGNDHCPIASFAIGDHVFTTEYHPEMPLAFIGALTSYLTGKLDDAVIASAREGLKQPAEGPLFAEWMVRFLEGETG